MKYENASDILPEDLLKCVQKFAAGKLIYVPDTISKRSWGETSGYKQYLSERNQEIREKFKLGSSVDELAEGYNLSLESIKKIVYSKKENRELEYQCSLTSAKEFAKTGMVEKWIHAFLLSDGHNKSFSDGLKQFERFYLGPVTMPLSLLERCCGPEEHMKYRVNSEWFEKRVKSLKKALEENDDMPPLIVHYVEHDFELNDGNHRLEALNQLGIKEYPVIVWITEKWEYDEFLDRFKYYIESPQ